MIPRPQSVGEQSLGQAARALFELGERDDLAGGGDHGGPLSVAGGVGGGAEMRGAGVVGARHPLLAQNGRAPDWRPEPSRRCGRCSGCRRAGPERMPEPLQPRLGDQLQRRKPTMAPPRPQMAITPRSRQGHRGVPASPVKEANERVDQMADWKVVGERGQPRAGRDREPETGKGDQNEEGEAHHRARCVGVGDERADAHTQRAVTSMPRRV